MYLTKSIIEGLKILGFDKEAIKFVSKERSLEEVFLSTLFLNYMIILVVFFLGLISGPVYLSGKELNKEVLFGLLMIYPFAYNVIVYFMYGFFGLIAEMLDKKDSVKPLISVGFHTAITYSIIFYVVGLLALINLNYALFLFLLFFIWFILTMFLSISVLYKFSFAQTLIIVLIPLLLLGLLLLVLVMIFPNSLKIIIDFLFA